MRTTKQMKALEKNRPKKDDRLKVEPVQPKDMMKVINHIKDNPLFYALFILGVNWGLRASDLIKLTVGDVKHVQIGESFIVKERKTGKERRLTQNRYTYAAIHELLSSVNYANDDSAYLLQGQRGKITVQYVNILVKQWCKAVGLLGHFGSHTLRKSFGLMKRKQGVDILTLMEIFGHSSQRQTLTYLCVQDEEVRDVYLNGIG